MNSCKALHYRSISCREFLTMKSKCISPPQKLSSTAKLRIWTLRIWGFRGPGFRSARQVLCGAASSLFFNHFLKHLSSVLGRTELCHEVWNPGPPKTPNHPQPRPPLGTVRNCLWNSFFLEEINWVSLSHFMVILYLQKFCNPGIASPGCLPPFLLALLVAWSISWLASVLLVCVLTFSSCRQQFCQNKSSKILLIL